MTAETNSHAVPKNPRFYIKDKRLFHHSAEHGHREVTHTQRTDGGGIDYLKLWVSGQKIVAGHSVGHPIFSLTLSPDGQFEGERPGGYEYAWIISEK
jgi:hypothetical protein